jgi:spermidine synthase
VPMIISNVNGPPWLPLAALFILPVTLIFGYTFPLTVRLFVGSADQASRGVGLAYAANTAGCVAGTVLAGFVLIPTIGTSTSIIAAGLVLAVLGGALAIGYAPRREMPRREMLGRQLLRPGISLAAALALLVVLFIPAAKLTYIQNQVAATGAPTAHYEDSVASVDVTGGRPASRNLYINGVGITKLTVITKELAYLPKAIRPSATTMLNICFGMGGTYRSSIIIGLHTTAVELDPTVPTVMSWFYPDASKYLHSPLGHIIISDGRNYVRLSDKRYNLITIDTPPPIWGAGTVVLLTQEFYQEAAQRLTPGGLFASYLPLESRPVERLILRTFQSEFRYMTVVWDPHHSGDYILGSQAPITFSSAAIRAVFGSPSARADLAGAPDSRAVPRSGAQWVSYIHRSIWLADSKQVAAYTGTGPLLTDDHPLTEYFLFAGFGVRTQTLVVRLILVVTGLLVLLIIGAALDFVSRRRRGAAPDPPRDMTGDMTGDGPGPAVTQTGDGPGPAVTEANA